MPEPPIRHLQPRRLTAFLALLLVPLAACRGDEHPRATGSEVKLHIEVTAPDGEVRAANVSCRGDVTGDGYLERNAGQACVTVFVGPMAIKTMRALRDHKPLPCKDMEKVWRESRERITSDGRAVITGTYESRPMRATVELTDKPCDQAAWGILEPLFTPLPQPRTIGQLR
jgi:hypothetical protein